MRMPRVSYLTSCYFKKGRSSLTCMIPFRVSLHATDFEQTSLYQGSDADAPYRREPI